MTHSLHNIDISSLRIIRYRRKSTEDEDRQVASLDDQETELNELNQRLKVRPSQILDDISESKSAKKYGNRPDFYGRLIAPIQKCKANAIEAWHPNRLSRNAKDTGIVVDLMDQGKLKAIITKQQIFWNTPMDKFMFVFLCSQAKLENDTKGVDIRRAIKRQLREGWRPGPPPIGYRTTGESGKKTIVPDSTRLKIVRMIYDEFLSGVTSVSRIHQKAAKEWGLRTRKTKKQGGKPLSVSHIYKILTEPFYYGWFWYKNPETGDRELWKGSHKPIITREEYDRIQFLLGRKGKPQPKTREFAYTGTMTCSNCGSAITAEEKNQLICTECKYKFAYENRCECRMCGREVATMRKPTILHYVYYHCTKKRSNTCPQRSIRVEQLEEQIDRELRRLELDPDYLQIALNHLDEKRGLGVGNKRVVIKALKDAHRDLERRLNRLEMEYTSSQNQDYSLFTPERFRELKTKFMQERDEIASKMKSRQCDDEKCHEVSVETFNFCAYARYHFQNGDKRTKRIILTALGSNLTLVDKKLHIQAYEPYLLIRNALVAVRAEQRGLEPTIVRFNKGKEATLAASIPSWLGGVEAVRTWICAHVNTFRVPHLPPPTPTLLSRER